MRLDGKVALITGAGSGIGAASARYMAELGASITLAGIPAQGVEEVAAELAGRGAQTLTGVNLPVGRHETSQFINILVINPATTSLVLLEIIAST